MPPIFAPPPPTKHFFPMKRFFKKKFPHTLQVGEETLCFVFISFPISKNLIPNFAVQITTFLAKLRSQCVFKFIQYGREMSQTVIQLKTFNLVINLSLISNKDSNLFSAICSEINAITNTDLLLL